MQKGECLSQGTLDSWRPQPLSSLFLNIFLRSDHNRDWFDIQQLIIRGGDIFKTTAVEITRKTDGANQYIDIMTVVMINIQNNNMLISLFPHFAGM